VGVYHGDVGIKVVYLLLGKESCKIAEMLEEAKGLVEEFTDVFLAELPDELPPFMTYKTKST
jgi:hypothetical protein